MEQRTYIVIDLKSFYASVECVERGLDSMTARLVVADPERTEKTICLSISPAMKALGIHNRCRVFEIPKSVDYIMAQPRMQLYIDYAAGIYGIYLKYISKEDIHVYSIDECFMDVTNYLPLYQMTARELGQTIMADILREYGIRATCGVGTNLYLAKVALDITAKHSPDFIGELDEETFQRTLWDHKPLTDFWRIGRGIAAKLEKYGIDVYGVGADTFTYNALLDKNTLTEDMLQVPNFSDDNGETRTEIVSVDDVLYKKLCDRAGAEYGSILLLNTYQYNDNGEYVSIKPFKDDVTQISLINAANEKNTLTIGGILEQSNLKEYGFGEKTPYPVRIVVPDADARYFDWFSMPSDEDDYTEYARSVMDEYFPIVAEDSYVEQGYTVRIARTDAMIKMLNIAIVLAEIVMYGFVILLILMGFTSVISTLTTNIRIRSREFAVLKSVGMTNKSLCRMLYSESIFCVLNALVPGVILGIAIPFLINLSIRKAFPVLYHIPWAALFGGIFVLIGIVFFITRTEIHKLRDKSIIDEIRMDIV